MAAHTITGESTEVGETVSHVTLHSSAVRDFLTLAPAGPFVMVTAHDAEDNELFQIIGSKTLRTFFKNGLRLLDEMERSAGLRP